MSASRRSRPEAYYDPLSVQDIKRSFQQLFAKVPVIPEHRFLRHYHNVEGDETNFVSDSSEADCWSTDSTMASNMNMSASSGRQLSECRSAYNKGMLHRWALNLRRVLDEYALLTCCIGTACLPWAPEMTLAECHNYAFLATESAASQSQLASYVQPLLLGVLTPRMDNLLDQVVECNDDQGRITRHYSYRNIVSDERHLEFSFDLLGRNAFMVRQLVLANIDRMIRALEAYLEIQIRIRRSQAEQV